MSDTATIITNANANATTLVSFEEGAVAETDTTTTDAPIHSDIPADANNLFAHNGEEMLSTAPRATIGPSLPVVSLNSHVAPRVTRDPVLREQFVDMLLTPRIQQATIADILRYEKAEARVLVDVDTRIDLNLLMDDIQFRSARTHNATVANNNSTGAHYLVISPSVVSDVADILRDDDEFSVRLPSVLITAFPEPMVEREDHDNNDDDNNDNEHPEKDGEKKKEKGSSGSHLPVSVPVSDRDTRRTISYLRKTKQERMVPFVADVTHSVVTVVGYTPLSVGKRDAADEASSVLCHLAMCNKSAPGNACRNGFWAPLGEWTLVCPPMTQFFSANTEVDMPGFGRVKMDAFQAHVKREIMMRHLEYIDVANDLFDERNTEALHRANKQLQKNLAEHLAKKQKQADELAAAAGEEDKTENGKDAVSSVEAEANENESKLPQTTARCDENVIRSPFSEHIRRVHDALGSEYFLSALVHTHSILPIGLRESITGARVDDIASSSSTPVPAQQQHQPFGRRKPVALEHVDLNVEVRLGNLEKRNADNEKVCNCKYAVILYVSAAKTLAASMPFPGLSGMINVVYVGDDKETCERIGAVVREIHENLLDVFTIKMGQRMLLPFTDADKQELRGDKCVRIKQHPKSRQGGGNEDDGDGDEDGGNEGGSVGA